MKFIKKYYLLLLLIITLAGATIYGTYAMFTSSVETNMVNMDTNMVYKFKINGTQELKVSANSKLRFNAVVENDMDGMISYGMYYKMISPTTLPSGVIIAQVSDDLTVLAKGQLESGASKTVPMVIKNTSDSEITIEIGVRTGYATETQGPDDIIYNEGEVPITSFQTSEEAGNDSCVSTIECTNECENRRINGEWKVFCVCNTGENINPAYETLQKLGLTANEGTPDFTQTATTDEGIYATEDDYGTTYYFRGAVENNYVKFAGYYWRIIRINGDGSIRLIYDGTSAHANGENSEDRQIGISAYNSTYGDNAYVGYMMGIDNECESTTICPGNTRTTSYSQAHANTYDSTIKIVVDNWYKTNIQDAGYSDKIADVIYCNDRKIDNLSGFGSDLGYGENQTAYMARYRLFTNKNPVLTCSQKNDAFTQEDTIYGNGALTYPVGLITADEVSMAGAVNGYSNSNYYIYTGQKNWTMSASRYNTSLSENMVDEWSINSNGSIDGANVINTNGIRPVISLKPSVQLQGNGTLESPFNVQ